MKLDEERSERLAAQKLEHKILEVRHKTELVKNDVYSTVHIILGERYKDASVRIL